MQFRPQRLIVRHGAGHQIPEPLRMVELAAMAELMHDDIVGEMRGQKGDAIVEVEIALGRTASPAASLIADGDGAVGESVHLIEMGQAGDDEGAGAFLVGEVCGPGRAGGLGRATPDEDAPQPKAPGHAFVPARAF